MPSHTHFSVSTTRHSLAVDAPPLVPIVGGILAIATALLPIALRPGEEAFEEVRSCGRTFQLGIHLSCSIYA